MELLFLIIPIYLFISFVAFYKWLKLSVDVNTLELEGRREVKKYQGLLEAQQKKYAELEEAHGKLKASLES